MVDLTNKVTVFVITTNNNPNYKSCIQALKNQDSTFVLDIVREYSPMPVAFQEMINRCKTPYYIQVDEDMILHQDAVRKMVEAAEKSAADRCMVVFWLDDPHLGFPICGVKIYKHAIFKQFPYNLNNISCEVEQTDRMKAAGYHWADTGTVVGAHSPVWTFETIFERYYNLALKYRKFGYIWMEKLPQICMAAIQRAPNQTNVGALLGWYAGMARKDIPTQEKDYRVRLKEFCDVYAHFNTPVTVNVYLTTKCNFNCKMCNRYYHQIDPAPDVDIAMINNLVKKFPTIRSACVCGYGEPFMSPNLAPLVHHMKDKKMFVGMVTNGSMIVEKLWTFKKNYPNYISVSLNASNAVLHEKANGTKTFNKVLDGIRLLVQEGIEVHLSYICTKSGAADIPEFISLAKFLGVKTVNLHNLLPWDPDPAKMNEFEKEVFTYEDQYILDEWKKCPDADVVKRYPILIEKYGKQRRNCMSPWQTIGIDGNGSITVCNSIFPPKCANGNINNNVVWNNEYCQRFRRSYYEGMQTLCSRCFRNWENPWQ